ncbi:MAG: sigma-70 family RNA polymerase sigma factor [Candidatus Aminicenantes bacterium]|jgi:RNA polymerase sigma-70 factor (ECF subfamily)
MYDDKDLVRRTLGGDKEAFEMIVQRYKQPLLNYIGRMVGERELALDFTQDVFIKTYASLHTYRPQHKFSTWLFKIASNLTIDYWRKKKIDAFSLDQSRYSEDDRPSIQIPSRDLSIAEKFELTEVRKQIEKAMEKIPPALRELFVWRHINEFSYDEIAEIKSLPVGTIKNKVFQAKELIRRHMEEGK